MWAKDKNQLETANALFYLSLAASSSSWSSLAYKKKVMLHYERHCFLKKQDHHPDFVGILQTKKYYGQNWLSGFCRMVRRIVDVGPIVWPFQFVSTNIATHWIYHMSKEFLLVQNCLQDYKWPFHMSLFWFKTVRAKRPTHPKRYAYLKLRLCFFYSRSINIDRYFWPRKWPVFWDFCS